MKQPYWERATFTELIISHLLSCKSKSLQTKILRNLVEGRDKQKKQAFSQSLYRLKKQGFIKLIKDDIVLDHKKYINAKSTSTYFKKEENTIPKNILFPAKNFFIKNFWRLLIIYALKPR